MLARTGWFSLLCVVDLDEGIGLTTALRWVYELPLVPDDFELDSKRVVNVFHNNKNDIAEFAAIIKD